MSTTRPPVDSSFSTGIRTDTEFYRTIALLGGMPYAFEISLKWRAAD
jgi:hypothetical protein